MFPSNRNFNGYHEPFHFTNDPSVFNKPFFNDIIPNSKVEDAPLSFWNFPSFDHDRDDFLHDLLLQQPPPLGTENRIFVSENVVDTGESSQTELNKSSKVTTQPAGTRKTPVPKKDRHSKITTAKGERDRRMRLSLDVARRFFRLQDMLGYDKASKTVEWLLVNAKHEIDKLEGRHPRIDNNKLEGRLPQFVNYSCTACAKSASSTSECEVVSGIHKTAAATTFVGSKPLIKEKKTRQSRKFTLGPLRKDMRIKARERARVRTSLMKFLGRNLAKRNGPNQLWSRSSFEYGEASSSRSPYGNFLEAPAEVQEPSSEHLVNHNDDSSVVMAKWSPSSIFNYPHNIATPDEHRFPDSQFLGKP